MEINFSKYRKKTKSKEEMRGWWGMNRSSACRLYISGMQSMPDDEIDVAEGQEHPGRTFNHEVIEKELEDQKGLGYKSAHKVALKLDKFTRKKIKEKLKNY